MNEDTTSPRAPATASLADLLVGPRARRLVLPQVQGRCERAAVDEDDVMQDVLLGVLLAQRSPASAWTPGRGLAASSYLFRTGGSRAKNALRRYERWASREALMDDGQPSVAGEAAADLGPALARILAELDLEEERDMATHLAAGCSLPEVCSRMGLSLHSGRELRDRVRALLMHLRDDP